MLKRTSLFGFGLALLFSCAVLLRAADDTKKAANEAPAALEEFQKIKDEWNAQLKAIAEFQAQAPGLPTAEQGAAYIQYSTMVHQAGELIPKLQAAAEKAYAADNSNQEVGDLLFNIAVSQLRDDKYEAAQTLCDFLIEHKYPKQEVYNVAAAAAYATMHLTDAKKYLDALGNGKPPTDPAAQRLLADIKQYEPLWDREQKLRAAEAKADDLPRVKLHTSQGDIVLELFENEAPNTVANFVNLVEKGFYNGTQFHRVLPGFMAQGGDPLSKEAGKNQSKIGSGGPGYAIACECYEPNRRDHFRGSLSMAHAGKDTGGSQFFLTFVPTAQLNGKHTVFGRVIDGMDVLAKLQRIDPSVESLHPSGVKPDTILNAEVVRKRSHPYEPKTIAAKEKN